MNKQFSPEIKKILEKAVGKPYKKITLDDIGKICPGNDLLIHNAKVFIETLRDW